MNDDERARRTRLWRRYVMRGEELATVVADLAVEFDVEEATIHEDVETIDGWLPHLEVTRNVGGFTVLTELRTNRQELHQLADQAREADDYTEERKIREEINRSLNIERRLRNDSLDTEPAARDEGLEEIMNQNL